ncbi:hypothetical protein FXO38_11785 [Capsicum annuum]|nr:hypothetical protein FXO38_11785 [Capsicum annuum]
MTRAPRKYSEVLVREFYAAYKGELQRQYPQGQLQKSGDPIESLMIRGVRVDDEVVDIRAKVAVINTIISELYKRPVVTESVIKIVIPTVHVPNIWAYPIDVQVEETEEERRERKRKRKEEQEAEKRARADSIQDKGDRETRVREMDAGAGRSRALIFVAAGVDVIHPPQLASMIESILIDRTVVDGSGN